MATIRRLADDDVRAIFESVHNNRPPPPHLPFQIVPVGPDGLKLSPPSFEFEDGLYVLLKPQKKKKGGHANDQPKVPSTLMHCLMNEVPPPTCPWSLSGPQFPQPTAIQQRYCYPKGDIEYSSRKGGALWTMYGTDGKEDLEYRLLHVYFSAKRAVNKGVKVSPSSTVSSPRPAKRAKTRTGPLSPSHAFANRADDVSFASGVAQSGTLESPSTYVTPDVSDFGRFHPVPSVPGTPRPRGFFPATSGAFAGHGHELDSFQFDMMEEPTLNELESCWNDPLVPNIIDQDSNRIRSFAAKLDQIHESIKECILMAAQDSEQGHLVSLVSDWAKQVALSPLGDAEITIEKV